MRKTDNEKPETLPELMLQLTKREMECLQYLLQGYSTKEIARELDISPRTVEVHHFSIKNKLGFSNSKKMIFYIMSILLGELNLKKKLFGSQGICSRAS